MRFDVLLYPGFDELDAVAPYETLAEAGRDAGWAVRLVSARPAATMTGSHGLTVQVQGLLAERPDVLVVPGGGWGARPTDGAWGEVERGELPAAIAQRHARGSVVASVCTGALLLAKGGLLAGRRATTHHTAYDDLAAYGALVGDAQVEDTGDVLTAGGVTAGLDLALALVERFAGPDAAAGTEAHLQYRRRTTSWA